MVLDFDCGAMRALADDQAIVLVVPVISAMLPGLVAPVAPVAVAVAIIVPAIAVVVSLPVAPIAPVIVVAIRMDVTVLAVPRRHPLVMSAAVSGRHPLGRAGMSARRISLKLACLILARIGMRRCLCHDEYGGGEKQ
jgi:hypothetical protein